MLKTMERVISDHIERVTLSRKPLHNSQHAYRVGRSTDFALHQVMRVAEDELACVGTALAIFMDIEGAFDKISIDKIKTGLIKRVVNPQIAKWVIGMLENRAVNVQLGSTKLRAGVRGGCPQGGVLSPLLWNITVDSLLEQLAATKMHVVGYADDVAVIARGKFMSTVTDIMRKGRQIVEVWCQEQGLAVNAPSRTL